MASAVIGALRVNLGIDTAQFSDGLRKAQGDLGKIGKSMQRFGVGLSAAVTAPIVGLGASILRTAGNFEASMSRVSAATGATGEQFLALEKLARELGKTTIFSAQESADAMEVLAKNGLTVEQILGGATQASLDLAAATGAEMANAADVATDVMLNFGKTTKDLESVVDGITGTLLESKFGFDDYRLAIAQAGGVAGGLGVEFEDFNAALALTSSYFGSGSDAGTSFKTFLTRLVPQSKGAAAAMKELGLEFFRADGSMKNMMEVAEELRAGFAGLSDEAITSNMKEIFGVDAMRTGIALMRQGGDAIEEMRSKINNASGAEQAAARLGPFNAALEQLGGAFEELQISIAKSGLIEFMTQAVSKLTEWVDYLSQTNPELLKWGTAIAAVGAALGPVVLAVGLFATGIAAIGAPVALVVAGVAGLTAAIIAFYPQIKAADEAIMTWARNFDASVVAAFNAGVEKVKAFGAAVQQLAADVATWFAELPAKMMAIGGQIIDGLWQGIQSKWEGLKAGVTGLGSSVLSWIKSPLQIQSPSRAMHEVGVNIMQGLQNGMDSMTGSVKGGVTTVADGIANAFSGVGSGIAEAIKGTKSWKDVALDAIMSIGQAVLSNLNFGGGIFGSIFKGLFGGLLGFQNGGSFTVGGSGGTDSQLVAFRASPGEMVDVRKGNQTSRDSGGYAPVYNIDARGADAAAVARLEAGLKQRDREFANRVDNRVDTRHFRKTRA